MVRAQWEMGGQGSPEARSADTHQDEECGFHPGPWAHRGPWTQCEVRPAGESSVGREDTGGTEAGAAEEEPKRGMRSQGSRRKWSLREGFPVREEWSHRTIWGGGETHALDLERGSLRETRQEQTK